MFWIFLGLGLIIGSFLNASIFRLHTKESIVYTRSHCTRCNHELGPMDLIPVLSFVMLRGRCRYCGKKISWQYPIVEIFTGLSFALLASGHGLTDAWILASNLIFISVFIIIAVYDLKHFLILDKIVFPFLILASAVNFFADLYSGCGFSLDCAFTGGIASALIVSGFFFIQYMLSGGRWIGFGDVKLGLLFGMVLGFPQSLVALFISYVTGAVVGVGLIAAGKKQMSSKLPFGTFLSFSAIITILFGPAILAWYLNLIGFA